MKPCLIIAEAGVNHNGSLESALQLCEAAKMAGADVIKFQTWKTEKVMTKNVAQAVYQTVNTGKKESQFDMTKRLELSYDEFKKIKEYCDLIGIIFSSTADEEEGLDFLVSLKIPFIKVASGDVGNIPYLRYIGSKGLPVILSTGMSSLSDVDISISALQDGGTKDIVLLHCTTSYPCAFDEVNLNAMNTLKNAFHYPVGYSDHTIGIEVPIAAAAMGARVIEKHFTLDRNLKGPDQAASTEPDEFEEMVKRIRNIEKAMGSGVKQMTLSERNIKDVVIKRIVALSNIQKGDILTANNMCIKRNATGQLARDWDRLIGKKALRDYCIDEGLEQ